LAPDYRTYIYHMLTIYKRSHPLFYGTLMRWIANPFMTVQVLMCFNTAPVEALVMVTVDESGSISNHRHSVADKGERLDMFTRPRNSSDAHGDGESVIFTTSGTPGPTSASVPEPTPFIRNVWLCVRTLVAVGVIGVLLLCGIQRDWCDSVSEYLMKVANEVPIEGSSPAGDRLQLLDNAKFLLQVFIVYSHLVRYQRPTGNNPFSNERLPVARYVTLPHWFDCFAMPLYALITGYVNKRAPDQVRVRRVVERILFPFVFFTWVQWYMFQLPHTEQARNESIVNVGIIPAPWSANPCHLWYLGAYLHWYIIGAVFQCLFTSYGMLTSAYILSWYSGYWVDPQVGESVTGQALALLPFYISGLVLPKPSLKLLSIPKVRLFFACLGVTSLLLSVLIPIPGGDMFWDADVDYKIRKPYSWGTSYDLSIDPLKYFFVWTQRVTLQVLVVWPSVLGFLALVPQQKTFFTELGQQSIYCYIFSQIILKWILMHPRLKSGFDMMQSHGVLLYELFILVISVAVALLLMSPLTTCWARYLIEPPWISKLWKQTPSPHSDEKA